MLTENMLILYSYLLLYCVFIVFFLTKEEFQRQWHVFGNTKGVRDKKKPKKYTDLSFLDNSSMQEVYIFKPYANGNFLSGEYFDAKHWNFIRQVQRRKY